MPFLGFENLSADDDPQVVGADAPPNLRVLAVDGIARARNALRDATGDAAHPPVVTDALAHLAAAEACLVAFFAPPVAVDGETG